MSVVHILCLVKNVPDVMMGPIGGEGVYLSVSVFCCCLGCGAIYRIIIILLCVCWGCRLSRFRARTMCVQI